MHNSHSFRYLLSAIVWFAASSMGTLAFSTQIGLPQPNHNAADETTHIFALRHLNADTALQIFRALYESEARLTVEPQSNSLVFRGTKSDLEALMQLLQELEGRASQAKPPLPAG